MKNHLDKWDFILMGVIIVLTIGLYYIYTLQPSALVNLIKDVFPSLLGFLIAGAIIRPLIKKAGYM